MRHETTDPHKTLSYSKIKKKRRQHFRCTVWRADTAEPPKLWTSDALKTAAKTKKWKGGGRGDGAGRGGGNGPVFRGAVGAEVDRVEVGVGGRGRHGMCLSVKQSFLVCSMGRVSEKRKRDEVKRKKKRKHRHTCRLVVPLDTTLHARPFQGGFSFHSILVNGIKVVMHRGSGGH